MERQARHDKELWGFRIIGKTRLRRRPRSLARREEAFKIGVQPLVDAADVDFAQ
ncbi:hypothetical protein NKJ72_22205 [Mesorhizobium sp. M0045]|uniref:hypothetical protein n=1 Tax=Mesorhizobium sp. M0045 TaxID=2956857 RepID=UPI003336A7FD